MRKKVESGCGRIEPIGLLVASLALASCRSELAVRVWTRIHLDGGIERRIELSGREADGSQPAKAGWLGDVAHVELAEPRVWKIVEERPGHLAAQAFFASAADLPPLLAHPTEAGRFADRVSATLQRDALLVAERWRYEERWGDPYGAEEVGRALDAAIDLGCEALRMQILRSFGPGLAVEPVERLARTEGRDLVGELLAIRTRLPAPSDRAAREAAWRTALEARGVATLPIASGSFWETQSGPLLDWSRRRVAAALSSPQRIVDPSELDFWPGAESLDKDTARIIEEVWGSEEKFLEKAGPLFDALQGYYAGGGGARTRFEARVVLPGTLLRTNGTQDGSEIVWFVRDEDLTSEGKMFRAESIVLDDAALRTLGARRDFTAAGLLHLTDILTMRDPEGTIRDLLHHAIERGKLSHLRDEKAVAEPLRPLARELADLLDPAFTP
jgi:hypothetical protein